MAQQAAPPPVADVSKVVTTVNTFAQEVFGKIAEQKGLEASEFKSAREQEREAEEEAREVTNARRNAERRLEKARREYALAQLVIEKGGAHAVLSEKYEGIVSRKAEAEEEVRRLRDKEDKVAERLTDIRNTREKAEDVYNDHEVRRAEQGARFERLYNDWRESRTDESFKELTGFLTEIARPVAAETLSSDVEFMTVDSNKQEKPGALIYYESWLDRKNQVRPIKSISKSTKWTEPGMRKGWYYFWAERGGKVTSDKERYLPVKGPKDQIEITEDR
jgi:hypothetical protein